MRTHRPLVTTAALAVGALALSSCAAFSDDSGSGSADASDGVQVAAAFYPLQYVAQRVAGDDAEVTNLTSPGAEPHDLELTVEQTGVLTAADLVVFEHGFQPSVDEAVEQNATGETVDAADVVELIPFSDEEAAEHAEHEGEEHADEEGEEHDHGDLDPHFWQDPVLLADLGDAVAERLSDFDPDGADTYEANAADLRADLEDLDQQYVDGLASCERDTIVVSHDAFGYLGKYGLVMAPIAGLSPDAEPTPGDLAELQQLIETEGITTVFSETLAPKALSETLAQDAGVRTAVLDPVEGLTDESSGEDYLSVMEANLAALQQANGCS